MHSVKVPPTSEWKGLSVRTEVTGRVEEKPRDPETMPTWDTLGDQATSANPSSLWSSQRPTRSQELLSINTHSLSSQEPRHSLWLPLPKALARARDPEEPGGRDRHFKCPPGGAQAPPSRLQLQLANGKHVLTLDGWP